MRPRVTLVSRIFAPEPSAASFRLAALVRGLAGAGARVEVLTVEPPDGGPSAGHGPSSVLPARVHRARVLRDEAGYVRGYLPYLSFDVPLVWRVLRARRPDVYVVEPPPTTGAVIRVLAALRGRPYVYYAADVWSDASASTGAPGAVVRVVRALEGFALRGAAAVLSVSDGVTERVQALGARHVVTVGNGVDTDIFTPGDPPPHSNGVPSSEHGSERPEPRSNDGTPFEREVPFLLYAGTASEWQGAEVFAEAMPRVLEEVPGARLVFLGQGSSRDRLSELAAGVPDGAVTLHDPVSAAESARWQRRATAALVSLRPGIGYDFAMPTKMFAALACGTPVVFAGPTEGPAAHLLDEARLGWVGGHTIDDAARLMIAALRAPDDPAERERRVAWVREHRSLAAAGERAARAVLDVRRPQPLHR
ncbi:glycosyltransferase family 4 protein [Ruania alba]|uniref:D-inositol 3-phosphate glycosyltransferase n=1 Tax=Ruania alba TaxID=648782 RepID=A0A1H5N986_9MICO|nr:glycosyltransferase family 4 protein [Ruania alba]SEE98125.1 Glycosyltransferase involved in cell wall bisynthesis [Ruania alba]